MMSDEQRAIVDAIARGEHVLVDAVAGSGKTSTACFIAETFPDKDMLLVTYSKALKHDVREKVRRLGIRNMEVHSYHSFATTYYDKTAFDNIVLTELVRDDTPPNEGNYLPKFDIIVFDEAQDQSKLLFKWSGKVVDDFSRPGAQLVFFGDVYQGIFDFMKADTRYLSHADVIWACDVTRLKLSQSFRTTRNICRFVNECMLGMDRMHSVKEGPKVEYYKYSKRSICRQIGSRIVYEIEEKLASIDDFFVLAPSLKSKSSNSAVKKIENYLVEHGLPCHVPLSDDDAPLDPDAILGKISFANFHQVKGRERPYVIIVGFDSSYFEYYAKDAPPTVCPATLYVAATRASRLLICIEDCDRLPLPFLKMSHNEMRKSSFINFHRESSSSSVNNRVYRPVMTTYRDTKVTDLTNHLSSKLLVQLAPMIEAMYVTSHPGQAVKVVLPPTMKNADRGLLEEISDLNGIVIPAMRQARDNDGMTQLRADIDYNMEEMRTNHEFIHRYLLQIPHPCITNSDFLRLGIGYTAVQTSFYNRISQINHTEWLSEAVVQMCIGHMDQHVARDAEYEKQIVDPSVQDRICRYESEKHGSIHIVGRIDALDKEAVWEFKCTTHIQLTHKLQLVAYAWMWQTFMENTKRKYKLLNILNGEVFELVASRREIDEVMRLLVDEAYTVSAKLTDQEFISENSSKI